jgi:predicted dehydrogenase
VTSEQRPFTVGAIFSANHGHIRSHVQTYNELDEVGDVHLCAIEGGELETVSALSTKLKSTTTDLDEFLARDEIEFVIVCARNDIAADVLHRCVDAGKHFVFEKPGAMNAAQLQGVADAAHAKGLTTGVVFQNRWNLPARAVKQARIDGAFGRVMTVETRLATSQVRFRGPDGWMFNKATAGSGILAWLACHHIDMACYLLDDRIVEVAAILGTLSPENIDVEDTAMLAVRFAGGAMGTIHAGYHMAGPLPADMGGNNDSFIGVRGTRGYARIDSAGEAGYGLFSDAEGWASGGYREQTFNEPPSTAYGGKSGEEFMLGHMTASRGVGTAPTSIDDAVHVLEVIDAALESSATGRSIKIAG